MKSAHIHVPDGAPWPEAIARCSHLGIVAHPDDLEFIAFHGIVECLGRDDGWFGGVVCTDGAGSSRTGPYANLTDEEMIAVRREEQVRAADLGRYGAVIQLGLPSAKVKSPTDSGLRESLREILSNCRPQVVYTHNPADKHDSHVAVFAAVIECLREMEPASRPKAVYGCEGWRGLDWLDDGRKVLLDVSGHDELAGRINRLFESQIAGGKRYDLAVEGRRRANATFLDSHSTDEASSVTYALDLLPLVEDPGLDVVEFACRPIDALRDSVANALRRHLRGV